MVQCVFDTVSERDMDLLFMEAFGIDHDFAAIFANKVDMLRGKDFSVVSVELSKTDKDLGESDITVIIESDQQRIGLLIEDKVNAIAMDQQASRYFERGRKGVEAGDYSKFFVFIACPQKYRESNPEAEKYEFFVSYEECKAYFEKKDDAVSRIKAQQLAAALFKSKRVSKAEFDENANAFLKRYIDFKNAHSKYAELNLRTKSTGNGYWIEFLSTYRKMWITHKASFGAVDLTFNKAASEVSRLHELASWLCSHGMPDVSAVVVSGSAALRINVPVINVQETYYKDIPDEAIEEALDAVKQLNDLTRFLEKARIVATRDHSNQRK